MASVANIPPPPDGSAVIAQSGAIPPPPDGSGIVAQPIAAQPSAWAAAQKQGHQNRMSALAGLTGMPTINMSPEDKQSFEQGKAAGAISIPVVAGATAAGASGILPPVARALAPIAKKYGIKALEGAGLGAGYELYKDLKKVFE